MGTICGICGAHGGHETAELRDVRKGDEGAGCVGVQEKEWTGYLLDDLRAFGKNADQWTTVAQDEEGRNKTEEHCREWNVSGLTGSLQRKTGLDYGIQLYISERNWTDKMEDSPMKACLRWLTRGSRSATSGATCILCYCVVLFRFRLFRFH